MDDADALRARLRDARAAESAGLHEAAHDRIVERVRRHGPAQVRRSRRRRDLLRASAVALPLALVGGWLASRGADQGQVELARSRSDAPAPACAGRASPHARETPEADGSRRIDLDEIGQIMLTPNSEATLSASDPCNIRLELARGRASVHAANLFGGELHVRAGAVEVAVHGTTFAVERLDAEHVLVDVESGAVSVERAGKSAGALLRAGERMRLAADDAPIRSALTVEQRRALRDTFEAESLPPHAHAPAEEAPPPVQRSSGARAKASSASARVSGGATQARAQGDLASAAERPAPAAPALQPRAAAPESTHAPAPTVVVEERGSTAASVEARVAKPGHAPVARAEPGIGVRQEPVAAKPAPAPTPLAPARNAAALVARADAYWREGALDEARASYRAAGALRGATAEAAWLALARNELSAGHVSAARAALADHARHFPEGKLAGEAAGIEFRAALQARDLDAAERVARQLLEDHPATPQAAAAERWLRSRESSP